MRNAGFAAATLGLCAAWLVGSPSAGAQETQAFFNTPVVVLPMSSPPFQRLFDFDGDGFQDAVGHMMISDGSDAVIRVWHNDGSGELVQAFQDDGIPFSGPNSGAALSIDTGDFNGDGLDDFFLAGSSTSLVYTSQGNGGFTDYTQNETGTIIDTAVADFDGNGKDDQVILSLISTTELRVQVRLMDQSNIVHSFTNPIGSPAYLVVGETDGDGLPDLLVILKDFSGDSAHVLHVEGGALVAGPVLTASAAIKSMFMAGDVDGDGDDDLVCFHVPSASNDPGFYDLFRRTGPATWATWTPSRAPTAPCATRSPAGR